MRRLIAATCFAILGFVSLWCWAAIAQKIPDQSRNSIGQGCYEIDKCPMSFFEGFLFFLLVFGPAVIFGVSAAIFSKTRRTWQSWLQLLGGLVGLHWVLMLIDRFA